MSSTGVVLLGSDLLGPGGSLNGVSLWGVALCDGALSTGGDLYGFIRAVIRDMIDPRVLGLCGACVVVVPAESLVVVPVALAVVMGVVVAACPLSSLSSHSLFSSSSSSDTLNLLGCRASMRFSSFGSMRRS